MNVDEFIEKYNTSNSCVSVHMNPVATLEYNWEFARDLKGYLDSLEWE